MHNLHHYLFLNATIQNKEMVGILVHHGCDIRAHEHGIAVKLPLGTRRGIEQHHRASCVEDVVTEGSTVEYTFPSGLSILNHRRTVEYPDVILKQSKVVLNIKQRNLQEA